MSWFEINGNRIVARNELSGTMFGTTETWGRYLGGRWCLDYTFKLVFGLSNEDWEKRCSNLRTDSDFYELCDWLGIYYKKDGELHNYGNR